MTAAAGKDAVAYFRRNIKTDAKVFIHRLVHQCLSPCIDVAFGAVGLIDQQHDLCTLRQQSVTSVICVHKQARPSGLNSSSPSVQVASTLGKHPLTAATCGQRCGLTVSLPTHHAVGSAAQTAVCSARLERPTANSSTLVCSLLNLSQAGRLQARLSERRQRDGSCMLCVECLLC